MKKISGKSSDNLKKVFVIMCVILLCGSVLGMGGIAWDSGNSARSEARSYKIPALIDLNLTTGYSHQNLTIYGESENDYSGNAVAAGDVNGDGFEDMVIGAYIADGPGGRLDCGAVYIIYGTASLSGTRNLPGGADVVISGADQYDQLGHSLACGNVNGDAYDDIIMGAIGGAGPSDVRPGCGDVYVVFGSASLPATKDLFGSPADISIYGAENWDQAGWAVTSGDVGGTGSFDDIILSANSAEGPAGTKRLACGRTYIINGKSSFTPTWNLNTTPPDTVIYGTDAFDQSGYSLATGDIDSNGKDDLLIGSPYANGPLNTRKNMCGELYLIYGTTTLAVTIDLNTTTGGTHANSIIYGAEGVPMLMGDLAGYSLATGDVSSTSHDDIIIGAPGAKGPSNGRDLCGEVYVVEGQANVLPTSIDLFSQADVIIYGQNSVYRAGLAVCAGDLNNDTKSDIIIAQPFGVSGPTTNRPNAGLVNIINGTSSMPSPIDLNITTVYPHHNITIWGGNNTDHAGISLATGDITGDNVADLIIGADSADGAANNIFDSGETYLIYGSMPTIPDLEPWITLTDPVDTATGVALNATVTINFSEPINQVLFNPSSFSCTPDPGGWSINWNLDGDGVELSHGDFNENTEYQFKIITANDLTGKSLVPHPIPNPWNFTTGDFTPPIITLTSPVNDTSNVNPWHNVTVTFNESMLPLTVTYTCQPTVTGGFTPNWDATNATVIFNLTLNPFQEKRGYWFNITAGSDEYGLPLADNPSIPWHIYFVIGDFTAPTITSTIPVNGTETVAVNSNITITFIEPMITATVGFIDDSSTSLSWQAGSWSNNNKTVTYGHDTNFTAATWYNITVNAGTDMAALALAPGAVENPFRFKTAGAGPQLISTDPYDGEPDVELDRVISIVFDTPMDPTSITLTIPSGPGGLTPTWNTENTIVNYTHTDFAKETTYECNLSMVRDAGGVDLIPLPYTWNFTTIGNNPYIISTTPASDAKGVVVKADIIVDFSLPMDTGTVDYTFSGSGITFTPQWNANKDIVTFSHVTEFDKNTTYTFEITAGQDEDLGLDLIDKDIPNPWNFTTVGNEPIVSETDPENGAIIVAPTADIIVTFSEAMDTSSIDYTFSGSGITFTTAWNALGDKVTFSHATAFNKNTEYTFEITVGKDLDGLDLISSEIPNPFSFTTAGDNPLIVETTPVDDATQVLLDADIIVKFSKPMNKDTVTYQCTESVTGGFTADWNIEKTEVTFKHTTNFTKSKLYSFQITAGKDQEGFDLIAGNLPNPFVFTTIGNNPIITKTTPRDDCTGVALNADIIVEFSKPMNTASVTYTCESPPAGGFSEAWNTGGDVVTYSHSTEFIKDSVYKFTITAGKDTESFDLVQGTVANPWSFKTVGNEPVIIVTNPVDRDENVNVNQKVIIDFSEPMSTATVTYTCTSDAGDPGDWTEVWSNGDMTLTLGHTAFQASTRYKFEVTAGDDLSGEGLVTGAVPNPFEFTTGTDSGPGDFTTTLSSPGDGTAVDTTKPTLSWQSTEGATKYWVYISTDQSLVQNLDPSIREEVTGTSYAIPDDLAANTTYYWTVIPNDGTSDGTSSGVWRFTTPAEGDVTDDKKDEFDWMMWIIIIIIIVVIVVIVLAVVLRKKEAPPLPEEEREIPPAEEAVGPETGPVAEEQLPVEGAPEPEVPAEAPPVTPLEQLEEPPAVEEGAAAPPPLAGEAAVAAAPVAAAAVPAEAAPPPTEVKCTGCGQIIPEGSLTCPACGQPAPAPAEAPPEVEVTTCPACSQVIPPGSPTCPFCSGPAPTGAPPEEVPEPAEGAPAAAAAAPAPAPPEAGEPATGGEGEVEQVMCPVCSAVVPAGQNVCPVCGASV